MNKLDLDAAFEIGNRTVFQHSKTVTTQKHRYSFLLRASSNGLLALMLDQTQRIELVLTAEELSDANSMLWRLGLEMQDFRDDGEVE